LRQKIRESPTEQKIRQTGIRKVQSSSSAQRERSHRKVTTMSSSSLKEEDGGTVQGHFPHYG
jgi:PAB1-binding protein PBP1